MNRDALVAAVAKATDWSRKDVAQILDAILEQVLRALGRGEPVSIVGFGQFAVRRRRPRRGVNPRNPRQAITIPAVNVIKFTAGKRLKTAIR